MLSASRGLDAQSLQIVQTFRYRTFRTNVSYERFIVTQIVLRFHVVRAARSGLSGRLGGRRGQAAQRLIAVAVVGRVVRMREIALIDRQDGEVVQLVCVHAAQRVVATGERQEGLLQLGPKLFAENRVDHEIRGRVEADEHVGDGRRDLRAGQRRVEVGRMNGCGGKWQENRSGNRGRIEK